MNILYLFKALQTEQAAACHGLYGARNAEHILAMSSALPNFLT